MKTILAIDQSTSGTKALLFDGEGRLLGRHDLPHEQKINSQGWVSHDPMVIYRNTLETVRLLLEETGADRESIGAVGISNQRETALLWDRDTGLPVADAVVWQCARAAGICQRLADRGDAIQERTGLNLSPYFPAAKWAWLLENTPGLAGKNLCAGTIDAWLVYKLTGGRVFARTTPTPPAPSCSTCGPFPGMRRSAAGSASAPPCFRRCALATASLGRRTLGAFCPTLCPSTGCWGTPTAPCLARAVFPPAW